MECERMDDVNRNRVNRNSMGGSRATKHHPEGAVAN